MSRPAAGLSAKQQRFVAEYLTNLNASEAARRAGYSAKTAKAQGTRLLHHPAIRAAVQAGQAAALDECEVTQERVIQELARIAFADIGHVFDEGMHLRPMHTIARAHRAAVAGVKTTFRKGPTGEPEEILEVKLWDKVRALELLGKRFGLFKDVLEAPGLEALIAATAQRAAGATA